MRGKDLPTPLQGTYIEKGQFLVYPFDEYTCNSGEEYKPNELGYAGGEDYQGATKGHEVPLFLSHGLTDWLSLERENRGRDGWRGPILYQG